MSPKTNPASVWISVAALGVSVAMAVLSYASLQERARTSDLEDLKARVAKCETEVESLRADNIELMRRLVDVKR